MIPQRILTMKGKMVGLIFIIALIGLPLVSKDNYLIHILIMSFLNAVLVSSWDILSGYGGIFSFGHPIFFGIGAYVSALTVMKLGVSTWLGLLIGAGGAAATGFLIGLPVLRLRGAYLAIVTVSFLIIMHQISVNWSSLTHGPTGLSGIPPLSNINILNLQIIFDGIDRSAYYYLALLILFLAVYSQRRFVSSTLGIHLLAIRDDEVAASAMGVNLARPKLAAFVLTSFLAGLVGAFYAHYFMLISPPIFGFDIMITIMTMSLIGGAATTLGPIIGAFLITFLSEYLREFGDYRLLLYGAFIIFAITFMPQGILKELWEKRFAIQGIKRPSYLKQS